MAFNSYPQMAKVQSHHFIAIREVTPIGSFSASPRGTDVTAVNKNNNQPTMELQSQMPRDDSTIMVALI